MNTLQPYSSSYQMAMLDELALSVCQSPQSVVDREENRYADVISKIADYIHTHNISLLLIAGPSASGKLWEDGSPNFETPDSLDIPYYQTKMQQLFHQGEQEFSVFDFKTNTRGHETFSVKYDANTCLILEGIHALNPKLMPDNSFSALRVYISPHTQFLYHDTILLTARQLRLTRRILRDTAIRGATPEQTLKMWNQVLRGEREYLHPFRNMADVHINTTHLYEPFLYAGPFLRLMKKRDRNWEEFPKVQSLIQGYEQIAQMGSLTDIPDTSLIGEFYHPLLLK